MTKPFNCTLALLAASLAVPDVRAASILGVDVSSGSGTINWTAVAGDGVAFAYAHATTGVGGQDPDFVANMTHGKAAGVQMGASEFAEPQFDTPASEANYFWNFAGPYIKADGKSISPVIDFEIFSGHVGASTYTQWFNMWSADVKAKTSASMHPAIYVAACAGACDLTTNITLAAFVANYSGTLQNPWGNCTACNAWDPNGSGNWTFWQSTDTGKISGISGNVDLDLYNGTLSSLKSTEGVGGL